MSSLSRELVFLILQFLDEEKFKETVHKHDRSKAVEILVKDLKVFSTFNEELFKEITQLLTLENFRENEQLSKYGDTKSARAIMLVELKKLIEANPLFRDKLQFPNLRNSRLRTLINQSLNWQHQLCKNPRPNPDIKTLFVDHSCGQPNGARAPSPANNPLLGALPKAGGFPPLGAHGPFQPPQAQAPVPAPLAGWMSSSSTVAHPAASGGGPIGLGGPSMPAALKHPRTPPSNPALDYPSGDSDHSYLLIIVDIPQVNLPVNVMPVSFQSHGHGHGPAFNAPDDLPKTAARTLNQGSSPMSMDFHPVKQTLLLVGTNVGEIGLWEVGSRERLVVKNFKVWDLSACSVTLQAALVKDPGVSVNRVIWSPDGSLFGVAYSRHIVQLYSYHGNDDVHNHLEIDAHVGGVNDLAFSHPSKQLCVITCGDDKTIKVWDAATGSKQYTFEGHEAPVYSVCPHHKENIQFIFSTALDGKIKAWLYDNMGSRVDYDAPGRWCTTMAYSADGTRLFSCGTSKEGESYIVEWNESEGAVKRTYQGFRKRSLGVVQFDTTKNRFLAAGDDFSIKFWDMDQLQLLTSIDGDGGLPASPRIRFNKDGSLLAVSANENGIKILANAEGLRLLRSFENHSYDASRAPETSKPTINPISAAAAASSGGLADRGTPMVPIAAMNGDARSSVDVKPRITEEVNDKSKIWKLSEINEPSQCRSLRLSENLRVNKVEHQISRLIFTNSGNAILALASNAMHFLWKWQRNDRNSTGKATASMAPQLWQPSSGILMTNDVTDSNPEEAVPCFALSKNDSYVMSASGGKISLFNMMTFKLCVWSSDGWEKQRNRFLQDPTGRTPSSSLSDTRVQFHQDQTHFLVVHETQLAIYETTKLECLKQWVPRDSSAPITHATFSCDSQLVYASFLDATVCVFSAANLVLRCRINPSAYLPSGVSSASVHPLVIAAHPQEANQFALGLSDGGVHFFEPLESEGKWGIPPPVDNGAANSMLASTANGASGSDPAQR
ncbi:hypothetical protein ACFE04_012631 [Oxalis oulophora]